MGDSISETGGPIPELFPEEPTGPTATILDFTEWGRFTRAQKKAWQAEKDRRRKAREARAQSSRQLNEEN